jgi:hypothetical protein
MRRQTSAKGALPLLRYKGGALRVLGVTPSRFAGPFPKKVLRTSQPFPLRSPISAMANLRLLRTEVQQGREGKMRIYAIAPVASTAMQRLRRAWFEFASTPADRGDGYARLFRVVRDAEAEKMIAALWRAGISAWPEPMARRRAA